jgi:tRNA modification GTPase
MDTPPPDDTIFALATPAGVSAVAVLRLSGPGAAAAIATLTRRPLPSARRAVRRRLFEPSGDAAFDEALVLWFPAPASFTGEDMAEFQIHGSRASCRLALSALGSLPGLRLARPGEFVRRAFDRGRLALDQVEALADLIGAETENQARQAMRQLSRGLGARCEAWRQRILGARARSEAEIDFPDEDLPDGLTGAGRPDRRDRGLPGRWRPGRTAARRGRDRRAGTSECWKIKFRQYVVGI